MRCPRHHSSKAKQLYNHVDSQESSIILLLSEDTFIKSETLKITPCSHHPLMYSDIYAVIFSYQCVRKDKHVSVPHPTLCKATWRPVFESKLKIVLHHKH